MAEADFPYLSAQTTAEIEIPRNPLEQVIGQDEAVKYCKIAAQQRRHVLMVGPPGTGKSMLAQATAFCLPKPEHEISVLHNPENPERPIVEILSREQIQREKKLAKQLEGRLVDPREVPSFVAERLGYRCRRCGRLSRPTDGACPSCGMDKYAAESSPFGDLLFPHMPTGQKARVHTTRATEDGREEIIVYEGAGDRIRVMDQLSLEKLDMQKRKAPRKVIIPLNRKNFIVATGASETELLGDVRHDPYGGHAQIGTPPYTRVVAGAIHESHEGVLFIDEISSLHNIQRFLLTAMQEKKYPIVGRNPQSSGASVRVDDVPCDFVLMGASNINDIPYILPPLRSRIIGNGYELLLQTYMPDTEANRQKLAQFVAQEIKKDGKIPAATIGAVEAIIEEARRRAKRIDSAEDSLTLRLRELSGVVRLAGDLAVTERAPLIDEEMIARSISRSKNIEEQLSERYGSVWNASRADLVSGEARKDHKEIR
jgi:ATP-dependent Lon protease